MPSFSDGNVLDRTVPAEARKVLLAGQAGNHDISGLTIRSAEYLPCRKGLDMRKPLLLIPDVIVCKA
jgi:hypothetical protein